MISETLVGADQHSKGMTAGTLSAFCRNAENRAVSLVLAAMVLLPLVEIALQAALGIGISSSISLVQHLTLVLGMLGGAVAAREGRLLSLSTTSILPIPRLRALARVIS